jgi:erythritol kinase
MTRHLIVALDSGTSVVKAVAFDSDGAMLATAARPNTYVIMPDGGAEQDMARSWDDAVAVLAELSAKIAADLPGHEVVALAITGQGDGTWLVDRDGEPVQPGWLWLDARAAAVVAELKASDVEAAVYAHTGTGLAACQQGAQLLWMARHRPEVLARTATAFHPKDFLYLRLTGVRATSPCEGCFTFGDWRTRAYAPEVIRALGLSDQTHLMPPLVDGTRQSHPLTAAAATATGLKPGLPVVLGFVDFICTTLAVGMFDATAAAGVSVIGSTGIHALLAPSLDRVVPNALMTGYTAPYPVPGHSIQMQTNMASTLNIDWLAGLAAEAAVMAGRGDFTRADALRALDARVAGARPGAVVFHPFISTAGERGPFTDAFARAAFLGLDQTLRLEDLARAVYEGLGFAARDCYRALGGAPPEIRVTGGAARSHAIRAILAACLDRPVRASAQPEAGAAGVAMMAAVQQGLFADMAACATRWVTPRLSDPVLPDPALVARYDALFPVYRDAYATQPDIWRRLHAVREATYG